MGNDVMEMRRRLMMGMAGGAKLIKVKSVIVANTIATTLDFTNWAKSEYDFKIDGTFYFMRVIDNSSTSDYKAISAVYVKKNAEYWIFNRNANVATTVNSGYLFDIAPNSTVEIYEIVA